MPFDFNDLTDCTVCDAECAGQPESRTLRIYAGVLHLDRPGEPHLSALDDERALACGQHHALILTERYLGHGTFVPADHTHAPEVPNSLADAHAELT
jgi:hypothetical protein